MTNGGPASNMSIRKEAVPPSKVILQIIMHIKDLWRLHVAYDSLAEENKLVDHLGETPNTPDEQHI